MGISGLGVGVNPESAIHRQMDCHVQEVNLRRGGFVHKLEGQLYRAELVCKCSQAFLSMCYK